MAKKKLHAENAIYHYLAKHLQNEEYGLYQQLFPSMVAALGIWLPRNLYSELPVVAPYAYRDKGAQMGGHDGETDLRSRPDDAGYMRDDNTVTKNIPQSCDISGGCGIYKGRRKGNGYVACHVWQVTSDGQDPQYHTCNMPSLNTFVPNLVWLPESLSPLTDRAGTFAQQHLQRIAYEIYRDVQVRPEHESLVEELWARLPEPDPSGIAPPDVDQLAFFEFPDTKLAKRKKDIALVVDAARAVAAGELLTETVLTTKYGTGLASVSPAALLQLAEELRVYLPADYPLK